MSTEAGLARTTTQLLWVALSPMVATLATVVSLVITCIGLYFATYGTDGHGDAWVVLGVIYVVGYTGPVFYLLWSGLIVWRAVRRDATLEALCGLVLFPSTVWAVLALLI